MIPHMAPKKDAPKKKKPSSVRHTRAIQRDRSKRPTVAPSAPQIEAHLTDLIHPATYAQVAAFHDLGLRDRILNLPVMVAFVLSLIWRQLGSVSEAVRVLAHEGLLWVSPLDVSQQAVSERLRKFPAVLFERVLLDLLPRMQQRWQTRQRPLPQPCAGHTTTLRPCWRWMVRPSTRCCAKLACCATARGRSWLVGWPPCSMS